MSVIISLSGGQWVAGEPGRECRAVRGKPKWWQCSPGTHTSPVTNTHTASAPGQISTVVVCTRIWANQGLILPNGAS